MSDSKFYKCTYEEKLFPIKINGEYNYVVDDPDNYTDAFAKILRDI
jgi:hypothetical protein